MKVLLTGAGGQVGREVLRLGPAVGAEVVGLDRTGLDVTDRGAGLAAARRVRPDAVVNAAAYTAVERAEGEPERAFAVNRDGARNVAEAAEAVGAALVHLSTDYVFDGQKGAPYAPDDERAPLNVYGASKAAGEDAVRSATAGAVVLRAAWVFSPYDGNFVTTMLRLARTRDRLRVVGDQWGHPTAAADVARAALAAAGAARDGLAGTLHAVGGPVASWYELAAETVAYAAAAGLVPDVPVEPIPTSAYPTAAARPARVELETAASFAALGLAPFRWRESLRDVIRRCPG